MFPGDERARFRCELYKDVYTCWRCVHLLEMWMWTPAGVERARWRCDLYRNVSTCWRCEVILEMLTHNGDVNIISDVIICWWCECWLEIYELAEDVTSSQAGDVNGCWRCLYMLKMWTTAGDVQTCWKRGRLLDMFTHAGDVNTCYMFIHGVRLLEMWNLL